MFDLKNKVIIVTGASGLLGQQHVNAILKQDGIPIMLDINVETLSSMLQNIKSNFPNSHAFFYKVDITKENEIKECCIDVMKKYGKIDGLVNNAANNPKVESSSTTNFSRLENFQIDTWNEDISVGLTGSFLCIKYFGSAISKNINGGSIVNISSDLGLIAPNQSLYRIDGVLDDLQPVKPVTYSVVKTGLVGLTRYVATYWPNKNVRCNAICPGGVENNQNEDFIKKIISNIPLGRMALKNEYQGILIFLLSDASSYITGSIIAADGGRTAW